MKRHSLASLGSQTVVYGLSGAAVQVVGLVTLPVLARVFSPAQYGVLEVGSVLFGFLAVVADAGLSSASQRSYFDYGDDEVPKRRSVLATALLASSLMAAALAGLLILMRGPVSEALFDNDEQTTIIAFVALALPLSVLANLSREAMRLRFRAWHYVASAIIGTIVTAAVGLALVLGADTGVEGVFVGIVIGNLASTLYGFAVVHRDFAGTISRPELRIMLRYGLPLIPTAVAGWALSFLDRVMLVRLADLDDVGQYAIAARISSVLLFAATAFALAYSPFILSLYQRDPALEQEFRGRALMIVTTGFLAISVLLSLFAREVIMLVAPDFDEAYRVVGLIALGLAAFGTTTITMTGISLARKTGRFARYSLLALAVNAVLNVLLIPPLGMFGAAIGTLVAFVTLTLLYFRCSQGLSPVKVHGWALLRVVALSLAVVPIGAIAFESTTVALAVKVVVFALYALALAFSGVLHRDEYAALGAMLADGRARLRRSR
jgi:O-antigen/teichoic acid export membrane protein